MLRHGQGRVVLIGYEMVTGEAVPALVMTGDAMRSATGRLRDAGRHGGPVAHARLHGPQRCPAEGKPVPGAENPAAMTLLLAGSAPLKDRQALADHIAANPRATAVMEAITAQRDESSTTFEAAAAAWGAVLTSSDPLTEQTIATAALGLTLGERKEFRDTLLAWLTPGTLDLELTDQTCLTHLAPSSPQPAPRTRWKPPARRSPTASSPCAPASRTARPAPR